MSCSVQVYLFLPFGHVYILFFLFVFFSTPSAYWIKKEKAVKTKSEVGLLSESFTLRGGSIWSIHARRPQATGRHCVSNSMAVLIGHQRDSPA